MKSAGYISVACVLYARIGNIIWYSLLSIYMVVTFVWAYPTVSDFQVTFAPFDQLHILLFLLWIEKNSVSLLTVSSCVYRKQDAERNIQKKNDDIDFKLNCIFFLLTTIWIQDSMEPEKII